MSETYRKSLQSISPYQICFKSIFFNCLLSRRCITPCLSSSGIRYYFRLMKTRAFGRVQARPPYSPFSRCANHKLNSDGYLECVVRHLAVPGNNLIGGCKMGLPEDNTTVVDHKLRWVLREVEWCRNSQVTIGKTIKVLYLLQIL